MSWTVAPLSRCVQLVPPSTVRKMPVQVAASSVFAFVGCTARRFVYHQSELVVDASWAQFAPPFVLLKTPAPRFPSAAQRLSAVSSPVAASIVFGVLGCATGEVTARLAMKSSRGARARRPRFWSLRLLVPARGVALGDRVAPPSRPRRPQSGATRARMLLRRPKMAARFCPAIAAWGSPLPGHPPTGPKTAALELT